MLEKNVPQHVAIIMDGNGRWANNQNKPRVEGHRAGLKSVTKIITHAGIVGIKVLTLYAFSSENWKRPEKEVSALMSLFMYALKREMKNLHKNKIRLNIIGDTTRFAPTLQSMILNAEQLTKDNDGLIVNIAANYGGRWDIVEATKNIAQKIVNKDISIDEITEQYMTQQLCMRQQPEIDLVIRTGGECRISNFLLWQIAYSELYFTDTLWPDFSPICFDEAIEDFNTRERRFGHIKDKERLC